MELIVQHNGQTAKLDFFNSFAVSLKYDAVASAFSFSFYFNPENSAHRMLMMPGAYPKCILTENNEVLLTGVILSPSFSHTAQKQLVSLSGYSLTGVLEDCEIPLSCYPLQSDGLSLKQIADKLIRPFGLFMKVDPAVQSDMDSVFSVSTAKESQTVKSYLAELAAQKNIVLTHNAKGELLFTRANTDQLPVLDIDSVNGLKPATSMVMDFNGQSMHSQITVMKQADSDGGNAGEFTIQNPYVSVFRPKVVTHSSGTDNDTQKAARTALADELKGITLKVTLDRWIINGNIIRPNTMITVKNPEIYLYNKTKWMVESVDYSGNEKAQTCTLNCVLPEVYNNKTPKNIFL